MLKIAICDDSRIDIERMEAALDELNRYQFEYDVYFSAEELLECIDLHRENYQLYIFDIEMPDMTGLELAKEVRKSDSKALFVFLTGHAQYVMDVFSVITFDYISKPVTTEKLESVLLRAMKYLEMVKKDFVFHFRKDQFGVSCDDILYIEKKGRQAVIHTITENFQTNMTVSEIWEQLDNRVFIHIRMSYIINMEHLHAIGGDEAVMDNGERLLVARTHKQELKEKHMEFMRRMI
ncbi:MAG: LytTR family DNA-binding domain-containing protein [Lachnospiraceae bacterium]|nr:LytTR family DNA-binding domain-containing protein [Lachnospiraceae bacterium]MDE7203717.1 LytTR family DNA-binding domain-containing protein [Lachnospiraceae bacterium]